MASLFDADISDTPINDRIAPLWTLKNLDDDEEMLEWMNKTYGAEKMQVRKLRETCLKHIAMFRGKFYADIGNSKSGFAEASHAGLSLGHQKPSKLVVNHLYDLTMQRVSRVTKNKPAVTVNPANSEYKDKVSARIMKFWVDYHLYQNEFDSLDTAAAQTAFICGEAYIASIWDPEAGEVTKEWQEEESAALLESRPPRVQQTDESGNPVIGEDGEPLYIDKPVKTGDVVLQCWTPLDTIIERCGDFKKAKYWFHEEYIDIDELRALYPDKAKKIKPDSEEDDLTKWREFAGYDGGPAAGKVLVRYFRHKPTPFLGSGRFVVSTRSTILVNKPLAKNERGLALARLTDIDVPKRQYGLSFFEHGKRINAAINDLTSMGMRNTKMMAHPRWVVPRGSVIKKEALGNDITIIEFAGPTEPKMVSPPAMNQELMVMRGDLKTDLQQMLGSSDYSRGEVQPNIRSALAMQMMDEQEDQRANSGIAKHANFVRDVIINSMNVASAYYEKDDKRLLSVVGVDNRYLVKEFDPSHLTKSYDVRVANSSGLPQTKAARVETLVALKEAFPTMMTDARVAELLQYGDADGFYDEATVAVKAAQAENEAMLNDEAFEEPSIFEDLIVHWSEHVKEVQNRSFKINTPAEVKEKFVSHIGGTEMLMMERAKKNPAFAIKIIGLSLYPLIFEPSPEDFMLLDRARTGNPLSLVEVDILYRTGTLPPGLGAAPAAGGINNGQTPAAPGPGVIPPEEPPPGGALAGETTNPDKSE